MFLQDELMMITHRKRQQHPLFRSCVQSVPLLSLCFLSYNVIISLVVGVLCFANTKKTTTFKMQKKTSR